jgi:hypothetical protein
MHRAHANGIVKADQLLVFPVVGKGVTIAYEMGITEPIDDDHAVVQAAFLHTDTRGRRVIRISTYAFPVSVDAAIVCAAIDEGALAVVLARRAATWLLANGVTAAMQTIASDVHAVFARGTRYSAMYHLLHAMIGHPAIRHHRPLPVDARMAQLLATRAMSVTQLLLFMYPRMIPLDGAHAVLPLTRRSLDAADCFLFHTWNRIVIWVKRSAAPELLMEGFGVRRIEEIESALPNKESPLNAEIHALVGSCWNFAGKYVPVEVVADGSRSDALMEEVMVDDSDACGLDLDRWMTGHGGVR